MSTSVRSTAPVTKGTREPPKFIVVQYHGGAKKAKPIVLVGKGITFDSGGISIKPSENMDRMKYDKSGAAAVLGAMQGIAEAKLAFSPVVVLAHDRVHFNRTEHPTAESTSQQMVEAFGDGKVPRFMIRDRDAVYGLTDWYRDGAAAEYVAVDEDAIAPIPQGLSTEEAGALGADGVTGLRGLDDQLRLAAGQALMVYGASGGIGAAITRRLARDGLHVVVHANRNRDAAEQRNLEEDRPHGALLSHRSGSSQGEPRELRGLRAEHNGRRSDTKTLSSFDSRPNAVINLKAEVK